MSRCSPARKQRLRERREAAAIAYRERVHELRATGASCANCAHFDSRLYGGICQLDSDFYGHTNVKRDHLCDRWKIAP